MSSFAHSIGVWASPCAWPFKSSFTNTGVPIAGRAGDSGPLPVTPGPGAPYSTEGAA